MKMQIKETKQFAILMFSVVSVAVVFAVISGLFESIFVLGVRDPYVMYLGLPVAWSGLPIGHFDCNLVSLIRYAVSAIGFVIDVVFITGLIILFIAATKFIRGAYEKEKR
jgi:hypothetical protein